MILIVSVVVYHVVINLKHVVTNNISVYLVISQGQTPLHNAAITSSDACCKALLDHKADTESKDYIVSVSS